MKALFLLFVSVVAFAQGGKGKKPNHKAPDHIVGQCVVLPGGGNLMAAPCADVVLALAGKGEPILARTDRMGQFEFVTEQGANYKLVSGSKFYEVVAPDKPVHSGDSIEVHLKQK